MSGYTKVSNFLFDIVMPSVSPGAFKVVCAVVRSTVGWNKESDKISLSQFQQMTGIANRTNLGRAITEAIETGYITRTPDANSFIYAFCASTETVPLGAKQYRNSTSASTEIVPILPKNGTETVHTKDSIKDIEIQPPNPLAELAAHFTNVAGLFPKNGAYVEDWELPLGIILHGAGDDLPAAMLKIEKGIKLAREKRFTIASPRSIVNIIANMQPEAASNGAIKVRAI